MHTQDAQEEWVARHERGSTVAECPREHDERHERAHTAQVPSLTQPPTSLHRKEA
jgi:hypothetical protein